MPGPGRELSAVPAVDAQGPVIVVGGGIGGLATALALACKGIKSRVLERRLEHSEVGAGIQIGPNGTRILEALGVMRHLGVAAAHPGHVVARSAGSGRELARLPLGLWIEARHGAPYISLHRADLHAALVAAATAEPRIAVETGFVVGDIAEEAGSVRVTGDGGRSHTASLAVAADGLWSGLRARGIIGPPLRPAHRTAYRAVIDGGDLPRAVDGTNVGLWLAPRLHAVHYPVRGGSEIALVVIVEETAEPGTWDLEAAPGAVAGHVAGQDRTLKELVAAAPQWRRWALAEAQPYGPFARGRLALVGDAAHPILPFFAQGAVMALEDASVLADEVAGGSDDVAAALVRYDGRRRPRVTTVADASRRNGIYYHLSGPQAWARDMVLRAAPGARLMAGYDWLYGWRG